MKKFYLDSGDFLPLRKLVWAKKILKFWGGGGGLKPKIGFLFEFNNFKKPKTFKKFGKFFLRPRSKGGQMGGVLQEKKILKLNWIAKFSFFFLINTGRWREKLVFFFPLIYERGGGEV